MMPILVESDDVRSGKKAEPRHGRLRAAQESMGLKALQMEIYFCGKVQLL